MTNTPTLATVDDVRLIPLRNFADERGNLVALQPGPQLPFEIARVFIVRASANIVRGEHAHKRCSQYMVCTSGSISLEYKDGKSRKTVVLEGSDHALLIPPGIWATQTYLQDDSGLMVLCDRPYEEDDYLRDYAEFTAYRSK